MLRQNLTCWRKDSMVSRDCDAGENNGHDRKICIIKRAYHLIMQIYTMHNLVFSLLACFYSNFKFNIKIEK